MKAIMEKKAVNKTVICLMVENQPNVLARISSLVGRRSFNISTITASETNVSGITKITLVVNGDDENVLYQIIAQMKKLENVNEAYVLPDTNSLYRELLLVKIKATQEERSALHEMTEIYRGKVVGMNKESMIIELTGSPKKIDGFMGMLEEYDIIEEENQTRDVPKQALAADIREGDVVFPDTDGIWKKDTAATEKRKSQIAKKMDALWE